MGTTRDTIVLILRVALAFAFLYPALAGFISPQDWVGYFPLFLLDTFPEMTLLVVFEVFEILLALWILSGWKPILANSIAAISLLLIVAFNLPQIAILFRDIPLIGIALVLILLERNARINSLE
ncbi:MAG: hypothetical protein WD003_01355 [Candidatus Paceibacterota bacterium]